MALIHVMRAFRIPAQTLLPLILLLLLSAGTGMAQEDADNNDVQNWPDMTLTWRMTPRFSPGLFASLRTGRNLHAVVTEAVGAYAIVNVNKYFSITPAYRFVANQPGPGRSSAENRYFIDFTARIPLGKNFTVVDRNREEFRFIRGVYSFRYRNRLQFERPLKIGDRTITPYAAGERFYDTRHHLWSRHQVLAGARIPLHRYLTLDGYYARFIDLRANPGHLHIIGTLLRMEF
ncbi:MAG: DUF2490 domain-containing protein [Blastocatellia bacterium]